MSFATYYISKEVFCSRKAVKEVCKERIGEEEEEKPCFLVCNSSFLFLSILESTYTLKVAVEGNFRLSTTFLSIHVHWLDFRGKRRSHSAVLSAHVCFFSDFKGGYRWC